MNIKHTGADMRVMEFNFKIQPWLCITANKCFILHFCLLLWPAHRHPTLTSACPSSPSSLRRKSPPCLFFPVSLQLSDSAFICYVSASHHKLDHITYAYQTALQKTSLIGFCLQNCWSKSKEAFCCCKEFPVPVFFMIGILNIRVVVATYLY